jgi:hypothetical protein
VHGGISLSTFDEQALADPKVISLAARTSVTESESGPYDHQRRAVVDVTLADGRPLQGKARLEPQELGAATERRLSMKFRDCLAHSDRTWSAHLENYLCSMVAPGGALAFPDSMRERSGDAQGLGR